MLGLSLILQFLLSSFMLTIAGLHFISSHLFDSAVLSLQLRFLHPIEPIADTARLKCNVDRDEADSARKQG